MGRMLRLRCEPIWKQRVARPGHIASVDGMTVSERLQTGGRRLLPQRPRDCLSASCLGSPKAAIVGLDNST